MLKMKKITAILTLIVSTLFVLLFCLLFTAPGNQLIAYTANKLVDGLSININKGRFLYNDAFDVEYTSPSIELKAKQLKLDLYWWHCDGICIENLSAQTIDVRINDVANADQTVATAKTVAIDEEQDEGAAIELPIAISLKRVAVASFSLSHASADVSVQQFQLSAKATDSVITLKALTVNEVAVLLKETEQPQAEPLTALAPLPNIEFSSPIAADIEQVAINLIRISQAEQVHEIKAINTALSIHNSDVVIKTLTADYLDWHLSSELTAQLQGQTPVEGRIELTNSDHQLTVLANGNLADLQVDMSTQGLYPLTAKLNADLKTVNFPFSVEANIKKWQLEAQNNPLQISNVVLKGKGNADDYALSLKGNSQLGAYPIVNLNADLTGGLTQITIDQLALAANESEATMKASANWQDGIKSQFSGQLKHLKAQYLTDVLTSDISGQFAGSFNSAQDNWQLKMQHTQLSGVLDDVNFLFKSDFDLNNTLHANINEFELISGENTLSLAGDITKQWNIDGKLQLNKPEQKKLPFTGVGSGELNIRGARLEPVVDLDLALKDLSFNDITVASLSIKSDFNYAADWQTNASIKLSDAQLAGQQINDLIFNATGDKKDHTVQFELVAQAGKAEFELAGAFANKVWQGQLTDVLVTDNTIQLTAVPKVGVNFDTANGDFSVAPHCWQTNSSKLCIEQLKQANNAGNLVANLDNLNLAEFKHLFPENITTEGGFSGQVNAQWQAATLETLTASLQSHQLAATLVDNEKSYRMPIDTFSLKANADAENGQLQANLSSSVLGNIRADIAVQDLPASQTLSGNVTIDKILLADLQPFIGTLEQLKGDISGQIGLGGSLTDPLLNGKVNIAQVSLQGEQLPVSVVDSNIEIGFDKTTGSLDGKLNDTEGGNIMLSGDVDWGGDKPAVNLAINGEQFYVRAQQGVLFKVSPDLKINLADNAFKLAGQVVVPYGRITIEELPEGAVQVSDDEIILDQQVEQAAAVPFDYDINLKLIVENDVRIDSFGLESKIAGDLSIKMDQQTPMIATGELNLQEGTYRAFGQDLIITKGQIGFSGPIDKPYLNIRAIRNPENTADDVVAGITLTGNVEQPSLKVFSEPTMDQGQSLAYLLNGQPLDEGDSSTDAMLTQLLLAQGMSRSEGVVSKVGETFGLSDVSLSSKGSGDDTKVEISGYVAPGIQVKYSVGVFESLSEVAIRYQLLSQLYVEVTSGLTQNVDILYKFDWDD
ncbi:translocation/assembly module TamB [Pseudoalteromonas shioyasakiensis]|uniref:autotransporter assembly complex protein TamB n=1 Tax=Pseudoalteromonas shioyasakiensis TaxID=1190813 RepID=UPI0021195395|nr:translocation/assembly module TamB domain-containing protein [Pseudoalteromonas shioyasakiensis]MCQ8877675.1 translocation/assembly module TamB [Pseudoalteromonas shioyasakiensis]